MVAPPTFSPKAPISAMERKRRECAVTYARASVALEGFELNEHDTKHAQRFIDGEIELEEFVQIRVECGSE